MQIFSNKNMLFLKPFAEKALQIPIICTFEINNSTLQALLAGSYALRAELNWELSATRRELTHYVRGHYTHKLKTIVLFNFLFNSLLLLPASLLALLPF